MGRDRIIVIVTAARGDSDDGDDKLWQQSQVEQLAERVMSHCVKQTHPKERAGHMVRSRHAARSFQSFHRSFFLKFSNVIIYCPISVSLSGSVMRDKKLQVRHSSG